MKRDSHHHGLTHLTASFALPSVVFELFHFLASHFHHGETARPGDGSSLRWCSRFGNATEKIHPIDLTPSPPSSN
eukprot:scaffold2880_cov173-Amphora_coffeaeformis.AAC.4